MRTCTIDGCTRPHEARGLCRYHYGVANQYDRHTVTCTNCGATYQALRRNARTTTCPPCSKVLHRGRVTAGKHRESVARWRERDGKTCLITYGECFYCRGPYVEQGKAKVYRPHSVLGTTWPRTFCGPTCADTYYRTLTITVRRHCVDCDEPFVAKVKTNAKRLCPTCTEAHLRAQRKARRARFGGTDSHRARARHYEVPYEPINRQKVFEGDDWVCGICSAPIDPSMRSPHPLSATVDCVVPMARGGGYVYPNVQAAHHACNSAKRDLLVKRASGAQQLALFT